MKATSSTNSGRRQFSAPSHMCGLEISMSGPDSSSVSPSSDVAVGIVAFTILHSPHSLYLVVRLRLVSTIALLSSFLGRASVVSPPSHCRGTHSKPCFRIQQSHFEGSPSLALRLGGITIITSRISSPFGSHETRARSYRAFVLGTAYFTSTRPHSTMLGSFDCGFGRATACTVGSGRIPVISRPMFLLISLHRLQ